MKEAFEMFWNEIITDFNMQAKTNFCHMTKVIMILGMASTISEKNNRDAAVVSILSREVKHKRDFETVRSSHQSCSIKNRCS